MVLAIGISEEKGPCRDPFDMHGTHMLVSRGSKHPLTKTLHSVPVNKTVTCMLDSHKLVYMPELFTKSATLPPIPTMYSTLPHGSSTREN
jgi:hypothetical protein